MTERFTPKIRNKTRRPIFMTATQYCTGNSSQNNEAKKKKKGVHIGK